MKIPQLTKDLAVIRKLSDLPNTLDGLTAAELKAKFDEAALEIQDWINHQLIPSLKAENLPFDASTQLNADNLQDAVELVFEQIRGASSGTITNGSVTKEKLAQELLELVFGGKVWVSVDKPSALDNPQSDFPVGRMWLRPGFTVKNAANNNWSAKACGISLEENAVIVTGSKTAAQVQAQMDLTGVGKAGDRVYVRCSIKDKDGTITDLTVCLNDGEEQDGEGGLWTAVLKDDALSVRFTAAWPSTSLADGSFTIENLAVVNVERIMQQTSDCSESADWGSCLQEMLPIAESYYSPRELYIQTKAGVWKQLDHEVFPVSRGGTGVDAVGKGEMLYGSGGSAMEKIAVPAEDGSILQYTGGKPQWSSGNTVMESFGALRIVTGEYSGTGNQRSIELMNKGTAFEPKLIVVYPKDGPAVGSNSNMLGIWDNPVVLGQNASFSAKVETTNNGIKQNTVKLEGTKLKISGEAWNETAATLSNRSGKTYHWTAVY